MPWSDWITSEFTASPHHRRHLRYVALDDDDIGDLHGEDLSFGDPNDIYAQIAPEADTTNGQAIQFDAQDGWEDIRATLPPEIAFLEEGVDYAAKPGSDPSDPYRFVDYDPDDASAIIGWTFWSDTTLIDRSDNLADGLLYITPDTHYPAGGLEDAGPIPVGTVFDTIPAASPVGTVLAMPPDPGSTDSFLVGIYTPTPYEGTPSVVAARIGTPFMTYTQPRWRYWKPVEPPLRQSQRRDGLGRSGTPRWSGGVSRQTSNRWRSPL